MGTPILRPHVRGSLVQFTILMIVMLVACETDPAGPGATILGHLQIQPVLESSVEPARLGLDEIHVTVIREWDSTTFVDTTVAYDPTEDDVFGWVLNLDTPSELMIVRAEVLSAGVLMFAAESTLVVDETAIGESEVQTIHLPFGGPGWNIASLEIDPGDSVVSHSDLAQFRVAATDDSGAAVTDFVVVWETTDPNIATIDSDAMLQAPATGRTSVQVIATTPTGVADSANVRFLPMPDSLASILGDGDSVEVNTDVPLQVQVLGTDGLGVEQAMVLFSAPVGASVSDAVVVTGPEGFASTSGTVGTLAGVYQFEAAVDGIPAATLRVVAVAGPGQALQFTMGPETAAVNVNLEPAVAVSVVDVFGNVASTATNSVTLSLESNPQEASLTGTTTVQAVDGVARFADLRIDKRGEGYRLSANADGLTPVVSESFDVNQSVEVVLIEPTGASLFAFADTVTLDATAFDGVENLVLDARFEWVSSNNAAATVDQSGLVTAVGNGTTVITVTSGEVSATAEITVAQEIASVVVAPQEVVLTEWNTTEQLVATVFDANDFEIEGVSVEWSSSNVAVAGVNQSGVVTANGNGTATITAMSGAFSDEVTAVVDVPVVETITVSPETSSLDAIDATVSLSAEAHDGEGAAIPGVEFVWSSSDDNIAEVDGDGNVTARANGSVTIFAASGEEVGTALVEVSQVAASVHVIPSRILLDADGATAQFDAVVSDANGYPIVGAEVTWSSSDVAAATVNAESGVATAVGSGAATITATSGGVFGTGIVEVDIPILETISVTPGTVSLNAYNATVDFRAEARDDRGDVMTDIVVVWSSSDSEVATVDEFGQVTAVGNGLATIAATSGDVSGSADVTVAQEVASVTVSPPTASLVSLGESVALSATASDAGGSEIVGTTFSWVSSAEAIATVGSTGSVSAVSNGLTTITATAGEVSGSADVMVAQEVASVTVTPPTASLAALGESVALSATASDAGGSEIVGVTFSWVSSAEAIATVGSTGSVSAVSNGLTTITATAGEVSGSADVTVAQEVVSVTVTPPTASLAALGESVALSATASDAGGSEIVGVTFSWVSSAEAIATVGSTGSVSAVSNGLTTITATVGAVSGSADVTVAQEVVSVTVTPPTASLASLGESVALSATASDAGGSEIVGATFSWVSSAEAIATVGSTGSVSAVSNGLTTITATAGEVSGSADVTVVQEVASVTVTPATVWFGALGETADLSATVRDALSNEIAGAVVSWGVDGAVGVVTVGSESGVVTAVGNGEATVVATSDGVAGTASATVQQVAASVDVTPPTVELGAIGETANLSALVRDVLGNEIDDAVVFWSVDGVSGVAEFGATNGVVEALGNGEVTVVAASGDVSGTASVTVEQIAAGVDVEPSPVSLTYIGATQQLTATVRDANGHALVGATVTWAACPEPPAPADGDGPARGVGVPGCAVEVDQTGLVTALTDGVATVTATHGALVGEAQVTVSLSLSSAAFRVSEVGLNE